MNVAVLGASAKPERYSYKAVTQLKAAGHTVFPVHPALTELQGLPVTPTLNEIDAPLDVVTVYLSPKHTDAVREDLLATRPARVIFNPGAENPGLAEDLRTHDIAVQEACTLVLLATGQFEATP
jgi:predicted CoA-binding protein